MFLTCFVLRRYRTNIAHGLVLLLAFARRKSSPVNSAFCLLNATVKEHRASKWLEKGTKDRNSRKEEKKVVNLGTKEKQRIRI